MSIKNRQEFERRLEEFGEGGGPNANGPPIFGSIPTLHVPNEILEASGSQQPAITLKPKDPVVNPANVPPPSEPIHSVAPEAPIEPFNPNSMSNAAASQNITFGDSKEPNERNFDTAIPKGISSNGVPCPGQGRRSAFINIPSKGLFYDPNRISVVNGAIRAFVLSGREELSFAGSSGSYLKIIDAILGNCLNSDLIANEMIVGDRLYSLIALRAHTYGADYEYRVTCPMCTLGFMDAVNLLEDLEIHEADESWGPEPFTMHLPINQNVVKWRLMRGFDEIKVEDYVDNFYKRNKSRDNLLANPSEECRNALVITSINGEETTSADAFRKKIQWLRNLDGMDMAVLRTEINDKEPGIKMSHSVVCPKCSHRWESLVRLQAEFFRPQIRSGRKH